jgi:hypothetical protein
LRAALAFLLALSFVTAASAHHSYAEFDADRKVTLEGTVSSVEWANPHVSFKLSGGLEGTHAPQEWNVETHAPGILKKYGWTENSVKPGTLVKVTCQPKRDDSPGCRLLTVFLVKSSTTLETKLSRSLKSP